MERLAIIGAGELGKQFAFYIREQGKCAVAGFLDDNVEKGRAVDGIPVIGTVEDVLPLYESGCFDCLLIGIGYLHLELRETLYKRFKGKIPFATFVHPSCYVASNAVIEEGCFLYPGCIVDKEAHIHADVILNLGCIVSHNSVILPHCFLAPRVTIAGFSSIASKTMLGVGTTVIDNIAVNQSIISGGGNSN